MDLFKYTAEEKEINKVLKYNQNVSNEIINDAEMRQSRQKADGSISSSEELLFSLGYSKEILEAKEYSLKQVSHKLEHRPQVQPWEELLEDANQCITQNITLEDILSQEEIEKAFADADEINREFSRQTSIVNKTDLSFLAIATALQVAKVMIFPYVAEKFGYGESFDSSKRKIHNDKSIEQAHKKANDKFKEKHSRKHKNGYWINILYQTPPYDITKGSQALGINMGGRYHRLYTLGHDPILGWLFGTMNILTDIITLNDFRSFRVDRKSEMHITNKPVGLGEMFTEAYHTVQDDFLNLPAAIFAQAQHLKSDVNTKIGLPVPILETINEQFASNLYKSQYDALCLARDTAIIGGSYVVSGLIEMIIGLVHGQFRQTNETKDMYEVRTRKILLISNTIATSSSIINATISQNPKKLDLGSLLLTITHLFTDIRFITKIKQEFIENEMNKKLQVELDEIDKMLEEF